MPSKALLLFIPTYNCQKQVIRVLDSLKETAPSCLAEVMVVDNGSSDNTADTVQEWLQSSDSTIPVRFFINNENYGLGGSHKVAYQYALKNNYDGVITLHGDDQAYLGDFTEVLEKWARGDFEADAILGSRFTSGSSQPGYAFHRRAGNYLLNSIWSILLRRRVSDIGSGLNFLSASSINRIDLAACPDSLVFNPQQLLALFHIKANVVFVPITWREEDQKSNAVPWKVFLQALQQVVKYIVSPPFNSEKPRLADREYPTTLVASSKG